MKAGELEMGGGGPACARAESARDCSAPSYTQDSHKMPETKAAALGGKA